MAKSYEEVRSSLARQAQGEYNDLVRSGAIADGKLLPESDGAPPAQPTTEPPAETPEAEAPRKYAEVFDDVQELEKGYRHLRAMDSRLAQENKALKEQIASLTTVRNGQNGGSPPAPIQQEQPQSRNTLDWMKDGAVQKLAETQGIDPMPLAEFSDNVYRKAVEDTERRIEQKLDERLRPMQDLSAAQAKFNALHPEAAQYTAELQAFAEVMPQEIKEDAQALYESGRYLTMLNTVWRAFQYERQVAAQNEIKASSKASEGERVAQRAAAGLPPTASPATSIRAAATQTPDTAAMDALAERARNGDNNAQTLYRREIVRRMDPRMANNLWGDNPQP